jgi:hypothetical protein
MTLMLGGSRIYNSTAVSCKKCGQVNLRWWKDRRFWKLVDPQGVLHRCENG